MKDCLGWDSCDVLCFLLLLQRRRLGGVLGSLRVREVQGGGRLREKREHVTEGFSPRRTHGGL